MIDALETLIALFKTDAAMTAVIAGRAASRHKFSRADKPDGWKTPAKGVQLGYDPGGRPDIYIQNQDIRIEARFYGEDEAEAGKVYLAAIDLSRRAERKIVATSRGNALLYYVHPDGTPQLQNDPDVGMDYIQLFMLACVSEIAV